jgi:hypothetical protein
MIRFERRTEQHGPPSGWLLMQARGLGPWWRASDSCMSIYSRTAGTPTVIFRLFNVGRVVALNDPPPRSNTGAGGITMVGRCSLTVSKPVLKLVRAYAFST